MPLHEPNWLCRHGWGRHLFGAFILWLPWVFRATLEKEKADTHPNQAHGGER